MDLAGRRVYNGVMADAFVTVLTLNIGLIHVTGRYMVPFAEQRRDVLPEVLGKALDERAPDAVLLQECFRADDVNLVRQIAEGHGYSVVHPGPREGRTGLVMLLPADRAPLDQGVIHLPDDPARLLNYHHPLLWASTALPDGRTLVVGNVHLTPLSRRAASRARGRQVEKLVELAQGPLGCAGPGCVRIWGGDWNLAPHHDWRWSTLTSPAEQAQREPWLQVDQSLYATVRGVMAGEVEDVAPGLWSLDARNPIWATYPLNQVEPSRRVDLLFVQGASPVAGGLVWTDPVVAGVPISDHYGVWLRVE